MIRAVQLLLFDPGPFRIARNRFRSARRARDRRKGRLILAGGLITDERGRVLLIHRATEHLTQWETPGGKIDRGETPEQTAVRELAEELDVSAEIVADLGAYDFVAGGTKMRYALYQMKIVDGAPRPVESSTFDAVRFFTWAELVTINDELSPNAQNILRLRWKGDLPLEPAEEGSV